MKFWLATANIKEAEELLPYGIFSGIITNPTVVAKEQEDPRILFSRLCPLAERLYYQIADGTYENMMKEAEMMVNVNPQKIRPKIPATPEGLKVIRTFASQGIAPMATVVPTASLMVLAIASGATAIAPYSREVQKIGIATKVEEIFRMQRIIDAQDLDVDICTGIYEFADISYYAEHGIASGFIFPKEVRSFMQQHPMVESSCRAYDTDLAVLNKFLKL